MTKRYYTQMKVFHYGDKIDSLGQQCGEILPPVHIRIKPTNVCCHNCRYCAYRAENLQLGCDMNQRDTIPAAKMSEIVDDIAAMGVKAVTFSGGGEPLCYPYLLETVLKLAETPIKIAVLTNGARLSGGIAEALAEHATWIRISIDGWDDASYAAYRGVGPGEFGKVMGNIERFGGLEGQCYLGVSMIVDADNAGHVYELIARLKGIGVDTVKIAPCVVSNDAGENNRYHEPFFEQVKEQAAGALAELAEDSFEIFDSYHQLDEKFAKEYSWCPYQQILPIIGADLNVYSCQDKAYNLSCGVIGSIKEQRFAEMWFADKRQFFQIDPSRDCNHHCVANGKNRMILDYLGADAEHLEFV